MTERSETIGAAPCSGHRGQCCGFRQAGRAPFEDEIREPLVQHLTLDEGEYFDKDWDYAARRVMSPPFRNKQHQDGLWAGLAAGSLQVVATDHCAFTTDQKRMGLAGFPQECAGRLEGLARIDHLPEVRMQVSDVGQDAGVEHDEYLGMFDTRILANMVFPTVVVRARDALGNQSSFGMVVALDNRSPLVTLDSPPVREARYDQGVLECSILFDPLGDDAANDGQGLTQLSELRVRVEDRSNVANTSSSIIVPLAGVQPSSVDLFILDDSDGALVVDTDGDGICDDINPKLTPTSTPMADNEVARLDMAPIPNRGAVYFGGSVGDPMVDPLAGPDAACNAEPNPGQPPDPLCDLQSSLTWAMPDAVGEDAIYTIPPVDSAGGQCLGNAFDSFVFYRGCQSGVGPRTKPAQPKLREPMALRQCFQNFRSGIVRKKSD